jgi:hypothetical protein
MDPLSLSVSSRVHTKPPMSPWNVADGDEIDASGFGIVDAKVIDLALVAASRDLRRTMVCVTAGRLKDHRTGPESSCLALTREKLPRSSTTRS